MRLMLRSLWFVCSFLFVGSAVGSDRETQFSLTQTKKAGAAHSYICSALVKTSSHDATDFIAGVELDERPLRNWLIAYRGSEKTLAELVASLPALLALSGDRDEDGHSYITLTTPQSGEPKEYSFETAVIASLNDQKGGKRDELFLQLRALVEYVEKFSGGKGLGENMTRLEVKGVTTLDGRGLISTYDEVRLKRTFDVRHNLAQALLILEQFESWYLQDRPARESFREKVLGDQTVLGLTCKIMESMGNEPHEIPASKSLYAQLLPRTQRLAQTAVLFPSSVGLENDLRHYVSAVLLPALERAVLLDGAAAQSKEVRAAMPSAEVFKKVLRLGKFAEKLPLDQASRREPIARMIQLLQLNFGPVLAPDFNAYLIAMIEIMPFE